MRLVFMGTPTFAVPVLAGLTGLDGWEVAGVYTPPDRPAGRGRRAQASPVKEFALEHGIPVHQPASLRSAEAQSELAALAPDAIIVAAYGKLLPPPVLEVAPLGCLNIHPSLLPRHRGPSPVATAILEGDLVTGVTLMLLDQGMDTGPLIAQTEYRLNGNETADELTETLFGVGGKLLMESLPRWQSGELQAVPQDDSLATVTRKALSLGMNYPVGVGGAVMMRRFKVQVVPTTYVIGPGGKVVYARAGFASAVALRKAIARARKSG